MEVVTEEMQVNANLLNRLINLRSTKNISKSIKDDIIYKRCFDEAINKFSYIVKMHVSRYKRFSNYQDLLQEGYLGLVLALNNFDPNRSKNFFKIANWYIKTKVKRAANKHDVIHVPIDKAKDYIPIRIYEQPILVEASEPQADLSKCQIEDTVKIAVNSLNELHKNVICMYYGINTKDLDTFVNQLPLNSIAKRLSLPVVSVEDILNQAHLALAEKNDITNLRGVRYE